MNRILAGLLMFFIVYCSGLCFGNDKAAGEREEQNSQDQTGKTKRVKKKVGPFEIGKKNIDVILDITEYEGQAYLYHSFEIRDETGVSYYKKELGSTPESATAIVGVYKLEGKSGVGLIFYFDTAPDAPPAGKSFQIFGIVKGKIKPLSLPISIYGELQPLHVQEGKSENVVRLLDRDLIKVDVSNDFFRVVVPLVVDLQKLTITPLTKKGVFDIKIKYRPDAPGTSNWSGIKFYRDHNINSKSELVNYKDIKKVEFINAYAYVQLKNGGNVLDIDVSNLWLKVKINDREGWVNDINSFVTLGLRGS